MVNFVTKKIQDGANIKKMQKLSNSNFKGMHCMRKLHKDLNAFIYFYLHHVFFFNYDEAK
jgi:hypothetical protein